MNRPRIFALLAVATAIGASTTLISKLSAGDDHSGHFKFQSDSIVLTRSVYVGNASTVTTGATLPLGCPGGPNGSTVVAVPTTTNGTTNVAVTCGVASDNGEFPNLLDSHNVWNNSGSDGSFGVSSPIFLDNLTTDGHLLDTLPIPTDRIVTSFSSKSELALNRSVDGKSITFMGYRGGPGFPTAVNIFDVSNANTPGVIDPTNAAVAQYYRSVAEVDSRGHLEITEGNAYSGDNGRAAIKGHGLYYTVG